MARGSRSPPASRRPAHAAPSCTHPVLLQPHQLRLQTFMFRKKLGLLFKKSCVKIDYDDQTPPGYMSLKKCAAPRVPAWPRASVCRRLTTWPCDYVATASPIYWRRRRPRCRSRTWRLFSCRASQRILRSLRGRYGASCIQKGEGSLRVVGGVMHTSEADFRSRVEWGAPVTRRPPRHFCFACINPLHSFHSASLWVASGGHRHVVRRVPGGSAASRLQARRRQLAHDGR